MRGGFLLVCLSHRTSQPVTNSTHVLVCFYGMSFPPKMPIISFFIKLGVISVCLAALSCYLCMAFTPLSIDLLPCFSLLLSLPRFVLPLTAPLHSMLFIGARFRRMNWPLLSPGSGREFIFVGQVFQNVIFDRNYPTK